MWKCYPPFGCFYVGSPWSGVERPVAKFPGDPESIKPKFLLYTRSHIGDPFELIIDKADTIKNSTLKKFENVYFIIHGYLDNGNKTWVLVGTKKIIECQRTFNC